MAEDWIPPNYAKPVGDWVPPDYAKPIQSIEPGILSKVWEAINTPAVTHTPLMGKATEEFTKEHPYLGTLGNFALGVMESQTSPLGLGLTALTGGANIAEKAGFEQAARLLHTPGKIAAGGMMGQGAYNIYQGKNAAEKFGGGLEATLGALGLRGLTGKTPKLTGELVLPESDQPPSNNQKYLPLPRGKTGTEPIGFVHGQEDIAENRPYNIDTGEFAPGSGTVLPREAGEVVKVPPEIAATYGTGLGKPARAPLSDQYTATKQLNAAPEIKQLPPGSGYIGGESNFPNLNWTMPVGKDILDIDQNAPAPEPFKADQSRFLPTKDIQSVFPMEYDPRLKAGITTKFDIDSMINQIVDEMKNKSGTKSLPESTYEPTPDLATMLKDFLPSEKNKELADRLRAEPELPANKLLGPAEPTGKYDILNKFLTSEEGSVDFNKLKERLKELYKDIPESDMTTLYRGESLSTGKRLPDWITQGLKESGSLNAEGRWYTDDPKIAEWYKNETGEKGIIRSIQIPKDVAEQIKVTNNEQVARFSKDPNSEYFLSNEITDQSNPVLGEIKKFIQSDEGSLKDFQKLKEVVTGMYKDKESKSYRKLTPEEANIQADVNRGLDWENGLIDRMEGKGPIGPLYGQRIGPVLAEDSTAIRRVLEAKLEAMPSDESFPKDSKKGRNIIAQKRKIIDEINNFIINKSSELLSSEEGALKLKPEVIKDVKDKILNQLRRSQKISIPDIYARVKDQVSKKQFDKIIDEVIESGAANYKSAQKEEVPINPSTDYIRHPTDAVNKLVAALKEAGPQREMQEQLYTQERGIRIGRAEKVKTTGLEGLYERMGKLKGELPKVDYEGLRMNKIEIDQLADAITNSTAITKWEKMTARRGLMKILTGTGVPQRGELALLSQVFGKEFNDVVFMHGGLLGPVPLRAIADVNDVMKTMMSSYDSSIPLRQGLGLIHEGIIRALRTGDIKQAPWWNSFFDIWKMAYADKTLPFVKSNEMAYKTVMAAIKYRPKYLLGREAGLALTSLENITTREEAFPSRIAKRIPGIGASERMATAFINKLRADTFDTWVDLYEKSGGEIVDENGDPTLAVKDMAKVINNSTGRGSLNLREIAGLKPSEKASWNLEKVSHELNQIAYSPRFIASRITMLNPNYYVQLSPFARKQALKSALAIVGSNILVNSLLSKSGADVEKNKVYSADWMKSRFGNTRIALTGAEQSYLVELARFITGKTDSPIQYGPLAPTRFGTALNFGMNKTSPLVNLAWTIASGQPTKEGGLKRYGKEINIPSEIAQKFTPMFMSDMYELYQDDPNLFPLGEAHFSPKLAAIPMSLLGGEVQTYNTAANAPIRKFRMSLR